jgi:hypothetical protein
MQNRDLRRYRAMATTAFLTHLILFKGLSREMDLAESTVIPVDRSSLKSEARRF